MNFDFFNKVFPGISKAENPTLKAPDRGDNTSAVANKKSENISRKIEVQLLDEKPVEKAIGSPEYLQPKVVSEAPFDAAKISTEEKKQPRMGEYAQSVLTELESALIEKGVSEEKKKQCIDQFMAKVSGENDKQVIDAALGDVLINIVKVVSELELQKETETRAVETEKKVENELEEGLEVITKQQDVSGDNVKITPFMNTEEKKPEEYELTFPEFNKQRNAFQEKFKELANLIDNDEQRNEIVYSVCNFLERMRRDKLNLHVDSSKTIDVWRAIFDEVMKKSGVRADGDVDALRQKMFADFLQQDTVGEVVEAVSVVPSPVENEKELGTTINDGGELYVKGEITENKKELVDPSVVKKLGIEITEGEGFYETYEEKISEIFSKSEFSKNKKKADAISDRLQKIMQTWNDLVERYEDKGERTIELLAGFKDLKKEANALLKKVSSMPVATSKKEDGVDGRGENSLTRVLELVEKTEKVRIEKINNGEKGVTLIMLTDIFVSGLSEDENKELVAKIEQANDEIIKAKKQFTGSNHSEDGLLEYRISGMKRSLEIWKTNLQQLDPEKGDKIGTLGFYVKKVTDIKRDGIAGVYLEKLKDETEKAEKEIREIWKVKKGEFEKHAKKKKSDAEKAPEPLIEKNEKAAEHEGNEWMIELKKAIDNIKKMTAAQFDKKYHPSQIMEAFEGDYAKKLTDFLHSHEHGSIDQFTESEKETFKNALKSASVINDEKNPLEIIIVKGNTYKVRKKAIVVAHKMHDKKIKVEGVDLELKKNEIINDAKNEQKEDTIEIKSKEFKIPHVWDALQEHIENFEMVFNEIRRLYDGIVDAMNANEEMKKTDKTEWMRILRANTDLAVDWVIEKHSLTNDENEKADLRENFFKKINKI